MVLTMHFAGLVMLTLLAAGIALAMEWVLLSAAIRTMKPASAGRSTVPAKSEMADRAARFAPASASRR